MEEAKKEQMGGRKAPTEWNKLVKKMYAEGKESDPKYKLGQAMKAAKQIYRKSAKSEKSKMNNSLARSNRRSVRSRKTKSRRNRYSSSTRRTMTI